MCSPGDNDTSFTGKLIASLTTCHSTSSGTSGAANGFTTRKQTSVNGSARNSSSSSGDRRAISTGIYNPPSGASPRNTAPRNDVSGASRDVLLYLTRKSSRNLASQSFQLCAFCELCGKNPSAHPKTKHSCRSMQLRVAQAPLPVHPAKFCKMNPEVGPTPPNSILTEKTPRKKPSKSLNFSNEISKPRSLAPSSSQAATESSPETLRRHRPPHPLPAACAAPPPPACNAPAPRNSAAAPRPASDNTAPRSRAASPHPSAETPRATAPASDRSDTARSADPAPAAMPPGTPQSSAAAIASIYCCRYR